MTPWQAWRLWRLWSRLKQIPEDQVMLDKLKSRKLWVFVITAALTALNNQLGLMDEATLLKLVGLAASYILGQGAVDVAAAAKSGVK